MIDSPLPDRNLADIIRRLLGHYDRHQRVLPWRARDGAQPDPYHVWLSEIMLQQTTVATVGPYFLRFLALWPKVQDMAAAPLDDVLHAWAGLGYYARARNLHKCAIAVTEQYDGAFPDTVEELLALPGVGPYTAAAVGAIAFNRPVMPLDGNIERVTARLWSVETPLPDAKPALRELSQKLIARDRPGDMAQALMDLGATICTPKRPDCTKCPIAIACEGAASGMAEKLPAKKAKKPKPTRHGIAFWLEDDQGRILFRRQPERGLLGGMMLLPGTVWAEGAVDDQDAKSAEPARAVWRDLKGIVRHTFTHFHLELSLRAGRLAGPDPTAQDPDLIWCHPDDFAGLALPTIAKKACTHALRGGDLI